MSIPKKPTRAPLSDAEKAKRAAEKVAKFNKLAAPRVTRAKKMIELVGNLASAGYSSTPEQVGNIRKILQSALDSTLARFEKTKKSEDPIVI